MLRTLKTSLLGIVTFVLVLGAVLVNPQKAAAACAALPTDKGTVTQTVVVPTTGSYRIWSRIKATDTASTSYYLQIDQTLCKTDVGDSTSIPANAWTWVDYQNGTSSSKIDVTLTAGSHTVTMAGNSANLQLDRIILTGDTSCTPTGTGDNCATPVDNIPPVVSVTSPTNGQSVTGTVNVTATATDDVAVTKVEFYVDSVLKSTATTPTSGSTYSYSMNTAGFSPSHTVYVKAYDSNNVTTSSVVNFTVPDTTAPTGVSVTAPTAGSTINGTVAMTAAASDNIGVTKVEFYADGALVGSDTTTPYSTSLNTSSLSNASHNFTVKAFDAAGNTTTSSIVAATVNNVVSGGDPTPPVVGITSPVNNASVSGTLNVSATATDNVGVTKVEFYLDNNLVATDTTPSYKYTVDTTTLTNTAHTLVAKAYDAAANIGTSSLITVNVNNVTYQPEDINQDGTIDLRDFGIMKPKLFTSGAGLGRSDINQDGTVDLRDFGLLKAKL